jgi:endonuclease I
MKPLTLLLLLFTVYLSTAQAPSGYYSNAQGLSGYDLKTALKNIIDDTDDGNGSPYHQDRGYGALFDAYAAANSGDTDNYYENDGTVLDMYSEKVNTTEAYNYEHYTNKCGNYNGEGVCYNREHLVPQSTFGSASPMKNDYFHVVPTDGSVNGARGSYPFGEVANPSYTSTNGSKRGPNTFPGYSGTVFEPIDEFKGDIARSVLYFAIRYEDEFNSSWKTNEVLANNRQEFFVDWYIELLLHWHRNDPVSQKEIDRNTNGFQFQNNRNPLIDHPEFAGKIWGSPDDIPPSAPSNLIAMQLTNSSVSISWGASQDNDGVSKYQIEKDNVVIGEVSSTSLTYTVSELEAERLYNFRVYAVDWAGNVSEASNELEVTTLAEPEILISENFDSCPSALNNFKSVSEMSTLSWSCVNDSGKDNSGAYQMNGFNNGQQVPSKDWLITTSTINFDAYENYSLSLWTSAEYGTSKLELVYSSTYDGDDEPSNFVWNDVPNVNIPIHPNNNSSTFIYEITSEDISSISGDVYLGLRYDTTNGDNATRWTVDDFVISGNQLLSNFKFKDYLEVILYPNPTQNNLVNFDFNLNGKKTITIYSMQGERLKTTHTHLNSCQENLNDLTVGSYFVKIQHKTKSLIKRLIVK